ncbi:MAG: hypothetical protein IKJ94_00495 [Oscillospiraceae bacterium]|nr:hypothetical protein [Oscillospiraceae bacterium]
MKKIVAFLLVCVMLSLSACGAAQNSEISFTVGGEENDTVADTGAVQKDDESFYFMAGDVMVTPGMEFDAQALPTDDVYQVPSCAFEGTDNVYSYGSYEITAYNDGEKEIVYSIFFVEPDVTTPEGLANGDDLSMAAELYGEYTQDGTSQIFTRGNTQLHVIGENDVVVSIELRLAD